MRYLLLALVALTAGCATSPHFKQWVGLDSDYLVSKWGVPEKRMRLTNGHVIMNYYPGGNCEVTVHTNEYGEIIEVTVREDLTSFCSSIGRGIKYVPPPG